EPLPGLSLRFHAQDEANRAGPALLCLTQPNGEFVGRCLPGRYRVTLSVPPGKGKEAVKVPARYRSAAETPWEVKVPPGGASGGVLKLGGGAGAARRAAGGLAGGRAARNSTPGEVAGRPRPAPLPPRAAG